MTCPMLIVDIEEEGKHRSGLRHTFGRRRESTKVVCETHGSRRESTEVVCSIYDTHENMLFYDRLLLVLLARLHLLSDPAKAVLSPGRDARCIGMHRLTLFTCITYSMPSATSLLQSVKQ